MISSWAQHTQKLIPLSFRWTSHLHGAMPLSLWSPLSPLIAVPVPQPVRIPRVQRRALRGAATWPLAQRRKVQGGPALLQALQGDGFVSVEISAAEKKILGKALEDFAEQKNFRYPPVPGGDEKECDECVQCAISPRRMRCVQPTTDQKIIAVVNLITLVF